VVVIAGIFFRRIQNVNFIRRRDRFTDENTDEITEGFRMTAPYGDVPCLPSEKLTELQTEYSIGEAVGKS
jgi:hypothetical protein